MNYEFSSEKLGFPGGNGGKESAFQCRRHERCRFSHWVGKIPGGGHGNPLQYSCLDNPMDKGAWRATVSGVTKCQTRLSMHATYIVLCKPQPIENKFLFEEAPVNISPFIKKKTSSFSLTSDLTLLWLNCSRATSLFLMVN